MHYHTSAVSQESLVPHESNSLNSPSVTGSADISLPDPINKYLKSVALKTSITTLALSLVLFIVFDFSTVGFQFVQEYHEISFFNLYLGMDGLSIYFVLLTTIIMPISLLSN